MDYIHFNPVKHGLVGAVKDWPHSTFHRLVERGVYPVEWGEVALIDDRFRIKSYLKVGGCSTTLLYTPNYYLVVQTMNLGYAE